MQTVSSLKKSRGFKLTSTDIFIICAIAVLYCPFFNTMFIGNGYIGDTMIQIRIGLDMIKSHGLILDDIYSWHQGLNWCPHEVGWYFVVGAFYKLGGLAGVIFLTSIFNYGMAALLFVKARKDTNPYVVLMAAAVARCLSFPNYNARPHLVSQLLFIVLIYTMMDEKIKIRTKCIVFFVTSMIMAWFHGGMIPLFFVAYCVFIVIELVYKNFKTVLYYLGGLVIGFMGSVLSPIGFDSWTYALMQSNGEDIWKYNMEWYPKTFSTLEITVLLLFLIAFGVDEKLRKFDKKTVTGLCFFCLFLIISCKYSRFMNFVAIMVIMFGAHELQCLLLWLNDNIFKIDLKKLTLSNISNYILSVFCIGFMLFTTVFTWINYFPTNTLSDISAIAAYDENVISIVKEKGYKRIYNSFNSGTWLAYYGIPVHIDNRTDLYMSEFSGTDYIRGKMLIANIDEIDAFVDEYDADALVLDLNPGTTDMYFADDLYASDRYNVIYDNTAVSSYDPEQSYRWMVVEVVR